MNGSELNISPYMNNGYSRKYDYNGNNNGYSPGFPIGTENNNIPEKRLTGVSTGSWGLGMKGILISPYMFGPLGYLNVPLPDKYSSPGNMYPGSPAVPNIPGDPSPFNIKK